MLLSVENLSHTFDKKVLYEKASFKIFEKEKVGIVGANGVGKTTLINILNGTIIPDSGTIQFSKGISVGYLDQYVSVDKKQTIMQYLRSAFAKEDAKYHEMNQLLNQASNSSNQEECNRLLKRASAYREELEIINYYAIESLILRVASGLGIVNYGMDTLLSHLSGGQKIKIILAKLLLNKPDLIILDEPTNFLDTSHVDWLVKYLKEYKGAVLIVSHNEEFLNDVATAILDIEFGKITRYRGNYQTFLIKKAMIAEEYERRYEANKKERTKLQDYINKNRVRASTATLAQSRQKKLDKIEVLVKPLTNNRKIYLTFNYQPISSHKFLEVNNLEIGYYSSLLPPISFMIKSGEKLAITGFNGIGKTTLIKTLIGELPPISGNFHFVDDAKIAYFEQEHHFENDNNSPLQEINNIYPKMSEKEIRSELAKCAIVGPLALQQIKSMSGGEQAKLKLCKLMLIKANILILDEPTNHLDVLAKESLLECLKKYQGTVILVSHEREFISKFATREYNIEDLLS